MTNELDPTSEELIGIVADLAGCREPRDRVDSGGDTCALCGADLTEPTIIDRSTTPPVWSKPIIDEHTSSCPWRRAVEGTIRSWRDDIARRRAEG